MTRPSRAPESESDAAITVARGFGELPEVVAPGEAGSRIVEVKQGERIELRVPRGFESALLGGGWMGGGGRRWVGVTLTPQDGTSTFWEPRP